MTVKILRESKDQAEFVLAGERHTLPGLMRDALLRDPAVTMAAYKLEHPLDSDSVLIVQTKGKTPKKAVLDALKKVDAQLDAFSASMKKALK